MFIQESHIEIVKIGYIIHTINKKYYSKKPVGIY